MQCGGTVGCTDRWTKSKRTACACSTGRCTHAGKHVMPKSQLGLQRRRCDRQLDGQKPPSHGVRGHWGLRLSEQEGKTRESRGRGARPHGPLCRPLLFLTHESLPHLPARSAILGMGDQEPGPAHRGAGDFLEAPSF